MCSQVSCTSIPLGWKLVLAEVEMQKGCPVPNLTCHTLNSAALPLHKSYICINLTVLYAWKALTQLLVRTSLGRADYGTLSPSSVFTEWDSRAGPCCKSEGCMIERVAEFLELHEMLYFSEK